MEYELHDSGARQQFPTGAVRDHREGKGRFDLLPPRAIARLAKHFEKGAGKYGDRNWELGMPISRFIDSALRHVFSYISNKTNEDHLIAAAWNLMAAVEIEERVQEGLLPQELADIGASVSLTRDHRKLIYLACPYTHSDSNVVAERVHMAGAATAKLIKAGYVVFSPVTHSHPLVEHDMGSTWEEWKDYDRVFLSKCDELFVLKLPGWEESRGVSEEIRLARELGIPVRYVSLEEL